MFSYLGLYLQGMLKMMVEWIRRKLGVPDRCKMLKQNLWTRSRCLIFLLSSHPPRPFSALGRWGGARTKGLMKKLEETWTQVTGGDPCYSGWVWLKLKAAVMCSVVGKILAPPWCSHVGKLIVQTGSITTRRMGKLEPLLSKAVRVFILYSLWPIMHDRSVGAGTASETFHSGRSCQSYLKWCGVLQWSWTAFSTTAPGQRLAGEKQEEWPCKLGGIYRNKSSSHEWMSCPPGGEYTIPRCYVVIE